MPFIYYDDTARVWFVAINVDHCDECGHYGMATRLLADRKGYRNKRDAQDALDQIAE